MRKMTKLAGLALAASMLASTAYAAENQAAFDFEKDDCGFIPIYVDYPGGEGVDEFYELRYGQETVPIDGAGKGLFLSGSNHSDDLFMGYYKELAGFGPGQLYAFHVTFRLATQVDGGMIGVGGSPGASVYVKGGIAMEEPGREQDGLGYYRLDLDKGNQGQGGTDLTLLGNLEKEETVRPGEYEWKEFSFDARARADAEGRLWLALGTDSGFEAVSSYYLDDILLSWSETADEIITRGEAVRRLYDDLRPAEEDTPNFTDVEESSPYWKALSWAQKNRLVSGYGDGVFGPEDPLTVEQAAAILYRYAGSPAVKWDGVSIEASDWAEEAIIWGIGNGLISEEDGADGGKPIDEFSFTRAWGKVRAAQAHLCQSLYKQHP